ncbi:MAG TPA: glycerol-3-phosphate 1-O-acyltransferase PlsY [Candidatus Limnocylindrales bacterium]|nr:glycerol-3-phosphate 1-O-acyltransferase PlsY [Candidatus Limnocylindrales bacterium]
MLKVLALLALGYLMGSIPVGWLVMKLYRNQDVRRLGSGNIGAANVYRAGGLGTFIITVVGDALKGAIPVAIAVVLGHPGDLPFIPALVGLAAVAGHTWPIFLRFHGGKGVATSGGVILVLAPAALVCSVAAWLIVIRLTRVASLSSLVAVGVGFVSVAILAATGIAAPYPVGWSVLILGVVLLGLVIVRHRANIERLARGRELKITTS